MSASPHTVFTDKKSAKDNTDSLQHALTFTPAYNSTATAAAARPMVVDVKTDLDLGVIPYVDETLALLMVAKLYHTRMNFYKGLVNFVLKAPEEEVIAYCNRCGFTFTGLFKTFKTKTLIPLLIAGIKGFEYFKKMALDSHNEDFLTDYFYEHAEEQIYQIESHLGKILTDHPFFQDALIYKTITVLLKPHLSTSFIAFNRLRGGRNPEHTDAMKKSFEHGFAAINKFNDCIKAVSLFTKPRGFISPETSSPYILSMMNMISVIDDHREQLLNMMDNYVPKDKVYKTPTEKLELNRQIVINAKRMFIHVQTMETWTDILSQEFEKVKEIFDASDKIVKLKSKATQVVPKQVNSAVPTIQTVQVSPLNKKENFDKELEDQTQQQAELFELEKFKKQKEEELAAFRKSCEEKEKAKKVSRKSKAESIVKFYQDQEKRTMYLEQDLGKIELEQLRVIYNNLDAKEKDILNRLLNSPSKLNRVTYSEMITLIGRELPNGSVSGLQGKLVTTNGGSHCQIQLPNIFKAWQKDETVSYDLDIPLTATGGVSKSHGRDDNNGKLPYSSHYLCQAAILNAGFTVKNMQKLLETQPNPTAATAVSTIKKYKQ